MSGYEAEKKNNILSDLSLWYLMVIPALQSESHHILLIRQHCLPLIMYMVLDPGGRGKELVLKGLDIVRVRPRRLHAKVEPGGRDKECGR